MNRIKKILNNKGIIIISIIILCLIGMIIFFFNKETSILKATKEVTIEYGNTIPLEPQSYVDTNDLSKKEVTDVLKNTKIDLKKVENEIGENYPAIGKYPIILTYKEEKAKTTLVVKDTTKPVFNQTDSITIEVGSTLDDLYELVNASDLQVVTVEFEIDTIDVNTVGEYTAIAIATDASENRVEKDITVIVTKN